MDKAALRKSVMSQLHKLSQQEHAERSAMISTKLLEDPAFQAAKTVGLTISRHPEVNTVPLLEWCWRLGKRVAVPKCDAQNRTMEFRILESMDQLETVYMDLQEPIEETTEAIDAEQIDLLIVPGVVFMESGYRIGFGGGYYDRYLAGYRGVTRSLAFDFQLVESVPVENHDIPVEGIITEKRTIDTEVVRR
ncbi:5-formyltetrahydrofolate cyclo-ligase [Planococcus sp. ISL-109]|uniref:5-formyltetrahydrofolate cyclo-ligase n=1 Tax=Planococcus sp. ISL-109 TaxID=2819166 RepID=UPI001BE50BF1|nr:5-formyltetrahydrofolate cyclo-ligase [Planococcus sp. ISL-109]MBT2582305.1 5-formyltetrahydrofolate cyclo-ligase [Planococcus sp. ISL-109]